MRGGNGAGSMGSGVDRLRRRCGWDRNQLRREVDRRQRAIALGLIVLFMAAGPAIAAQTAQAAYERGVAAERMQAATRHQVSATVTDPGSQSVSVRRGTRVSWTEPDSSRHTGLTLAWRGKPDKGESQPIWINASGQPTTRPRAHSHTLIDTWTAALGTPLGIAIPFLTAFLLFRHRLDRRRYRDWDTAWAQLDSHSTN